MGLTQYRSIRPPNSTLRIPAPPGAYRFDAVFVNAVSDLRDLLVAPLADQPPAADD